MRDRFRTLLAFPRRHPAWTLAVASLVALLGYGGRMHQRGRRADAERTRAEDALARQDFDAARRHLAACSSQRPADPGLSLLAAQAARRAEDYDEAEEHLRRYRDLVGEPTDEGTLELALLMAQRGALTQVEQTLLARLAARDPATDLILESLALSYVTAYRLDEALYMLDRLLARQPDHLTGLLARGLIYESSTHHEKALADYRHAARTHPDSPRALLRLALALQATRQGREAIPFFEWLLKAEPTNPRALLGLAACRRESGDFAGAVALLDRLDAAYPDNEEGVVPRGRIAMQQGRLDEAERLLRRAVGLRPADYQARHHLALCLQAQGKQDEAKAHRVRADEIDADRKRMFRLYPEAMRAPKDPAPRLELGRICLRNGEDEEALRWLSGALHVAPDCRPAHRLLADYYDKHGDAERAAFHRRRAGSP